MDLKSLTCILPKAAIQAPDLEQHACRVTPKGCTPVEGPTATKAWSALFSSQDSARALGYSGAKQFGLQQPRVQRLLQSLPGAACCERYAAWLGQPPVVPALVWCCSVCVTLQCIQHSICKPSHICVELVHTVSGWQVSSNQPCSRHTHFLLFCFSLGQNAPYQYLELGASMH